MTAPTTRELIAASKIVGVRIQVIELRAAEKVEDAFAAMISQRADALMVLQDRTFLGRAKQVFGCVKGHAKPQTFLHAATHPRP